MTTTDAPARHVRTGLQRTRDIALTVMAVLVSVVCAVLLYVTIAAGSALSQLGRSPAVPAVPAVPAENFEPSPSATGSNGELCLPGENIPGC